MDTETEARGTLPVEQFERWLQERVDQRAAFLRACIAWASSRGGEMWWPDDRAAVLKIGVPCDDCVTVVHEAADELHEVEADGGHWLVVLAVAPGRHWSEGIIAKCGRAPAGA